MRIEVQVCALHLHRHDLCVTIAVGIRTEWGGLHGTFSDHVKRHVDADARANFFGVLHPGTRFFSRG